MLKSHSMRASWTGAITLVLMGLSLGQQAAAQSIYAARFEPGQWDQADWIEVKSPRFDQINAWVQRDTHIENARPADAPRERLISGRDSYASMVLAEPIDTREGVRVSSTMLFEHRQAPQIVLANEIARGEDGTPEHREHLEIVLFDEGVNIWHHDYEAGEAHFRLVAFSRFDLESDVRHEMHVTINRPRGRMRDPGAGRMLTIEVGEHSFAYYAPTLESELYAGIIGCYSANHFYDFTVSALDE